MVFFVYVLGERKKEDRLLFLATGIETKLNVPAQINLFFVLLNAPWRISVLWNVLDIPHMDTQILE